MMKASGMLRVDAREVAKGFTMRVRITNRNRLAFRMQLARWLITIAAKLVGMGVQIVEIDA